MSTSMLHNIRFNRLKVYQTTPVPKETAALAAALHPGRAKPCGPNQTKQQGWASPYGFHDEDLVVTVGNYHLLAFQEEKKMLPISMLKEKLANKVHEIEKEEGRPLSKKEQKKIRDDLQFELLPQAFSQKKLHWVILDTLHDRLLMSTTTESITDAVRVLLKRAFPEFSAYPLKAEDKTADCFKACLLEAPRKNWTLGTACVFVDNANQQQAVHIKQQNLTEPDILNHLAHHKSVQSIAMTWQDSLQVTLHDDLTLSNIKCLEADAPLNQPDPEGDPRLLFESQLCFLAETLTQCTHELINWFSVEPIEKEKAAS
jgi:recombination associated protein RdgC